MPLFLAELARITPLTLDQAGCSESVTQANHERVKS